MKPGGRTLYEDSKAQDSIVFLKRRTWEWKSIFNRRR